MQYNFLRANLFSALLVWPNSSLVQRCWTMHAAPESERKIDDFCCPICDEVLSNPVILPCKHRFCFKCIAAATFDDSSLTASLAESTTFMESAMRQVADPTTRAAESSLHSANNIRPPVRGRGSKCTLVRGACPVCKNPTLTMNLGCVWTRSWMISSGLISLTRTLTELQERFHARFDRELG